MTRQIIVTTHDEYTLEVEESLTDDEAMEWADGQIALGHVDRSDAWTDYAFATD